MKITKKQSNSKMCIICGMDNDAGVKAQFYEMEDKSLYTIFKFKEIHQSYPGRVHGGMISAMLDELACRAFWIYEPNKLAVTMTMNVKLRKPVPYEKEVKGLGVITKITQRYFEAECRILSSENVLLAEGTFRYMILPPQNITDADFDDEMCYYIDDKLEEIEMPNETR